MVRKACFYEGKRTVLRTLLKYLWLSVTAC